MRNCEEGRGRYGKQLVGRCTPPRMHNGCARRQQQQPGGAAEQDPDAMVPAETQAERNDADRDDNGQHLQVKVVVAELPGKRQQPDEEGQREAMQQAQSRQRDGGLVQCRIRFAAAVIHGGLP